MNLSVVDPALQDWSTSGTMYDPPQPWDQDTSGKIRIDRLPSSVAPEATQDPSEQASPKRTRGRPKGSKNKNPKEKTAPPVKQPKRRGRPPGVKDKPRDPNDPDRKLRGRPKGTKNKPRDPSQAEAKPLGRPRIYPVGTTKRDRRQAILRAEEEAMAANGGVLPEEMRIAKEARERTAQLRRQNREERARRNKGEGQEDTNDSEGNSKVKPGNGASADFGEGTSSSKMPQSLEERQASHDEDSLQPIESRPLDVTIGTSLSAIDAVLPMDAPISVGSAVPFDSHQHAHPSMQPFPLGEIAVPVAPSPRTTNDVTAEASLIHLLALQNAPAIRPGVLTSTSGLLEDVKQPHSQLFDFASSSGPLHGGIPTGFVPDQSGN